MIDLDELERQLRAAAGSRESSPPAAAGTDDPLAELARIVGQDDAGRGMWSAQGGASERATGRPPAPSFDDLIDAGSPRRDVLGDRHEPEMGSPHDHAARQWEQPAPEQAEWAARTPQRDDRYAPAPHEAHEYVEEGDPVYEVEGQLPPHEELLPQSRPPAPRKRGWLAMGAVVGVAVVGVAGAMVMRSPTGAKLAAGLPPLIKADPSPSKVAPENPGGIEVPNQDRQIYAKGTSEDLKGVKIVGGEEQPVDVAQATRKDVPQAAAPVPAPAAPTQTASTSTSPDPATLPRPAVAVVPGLGEARKVKTVSVRPDGTIIDAPAAPAAAPEAPPAPAQPARVASLMPTMEMPTAVATPQAAPAPVAAKPKPVSTTTTASTTPAKPKPDTTASAGTSPAAAPAPKPPKPTQVASAASDDTTASPAPGGGGAFAVQLAAPASEQEARDTSSRLQKRFASELGDRRPVIRKADVNGKTIYRVRVSGLDKDEANALCGKLQSAGGQCFVAKN